MKHIISSVVVLLSVALLTGCSNEPQAKVVSSKPDNIVATSIPTLATLAGIETNPHNYLGPDSRLDVLGAVEGTLTEVEYSKIDLTTEENGAVLGSLAQSVMAVNVSRSTFKVPQEIFVVTSGGYLSTSVRGVLGRPSGDLGEMGVIEYETLGGARPPVKGDKVILFLRTSGNSISSKAAYSVAGASYGRFTLDPLVGGYSRQIKSEGQMLILSPGQVVEAFGE